jgi:glutaredoxin
MLKKITQKNWNFIKTAILIITIVIALLLLYNYFSRGLESYTNNGNTRLENEFVMYKMNWCPYCQKAEPTFKSLSNDFEFYKIKDQKVVFNIVDCEKYERRCDSRNVNKYPTYILEKKEGSNHSYQGPLTKIGLQDFFERHF